MTKVQRTDQKTFEGPVVPRSVKEGKRAFRYSSQRFIVLRCHPGRTKVALKSIHRQCRYERCRRWTIFIFLKPADSKREIDNLTLKLLLRFYRKFFHQVRYHFWYILSPVGSIFINSTTDNAFPNKLFVLGIINGANKSSCFVVNRVNC